MQFIIHMVGTKLLSCYFALFVLTCQYFAGGSHVGRGKPMLEAIGATLLMYQVPSICTFDVRTVLGLSGSLTDFRQVTHFQKQVGYLLVLGIQWYGIYGMRKTVPFGPQIDLTLSGQTLDCCPQTERRRGPSVVWREGKEAPMTRQWLAPLLNLGHNHQTWGSSCKDLPYSDCFWVGHKILQ